MDYLPFSVRAASLCCVDYIFLRARSTSVATVDCARILKALDLLWEPSTVLNVLFCANLGLLFSRTTEFSFFRVILAFSSNNKVRLSDGTRETRVNVSLFELYTVFQSDTADRALVSWAAFDKSAILSTDSDFIVGGENWSREERKR